MGEAKLKGPDLVQQALDQMYPEDSEGTLDAAKRILRARGKLHIHAEQPGVTPSEGSVATVCCEHHLVGAIDEAFVNARGLIVAGQVPHIWFSA